MFANLFIGVCAASCMYSLVGLAALARFLPSLLGLARYLTRLLLVCSFRLYRLILMFVAPYAKRYGKIDVLSGWARLLTTASLSLVLTLAILLLLQMDISVWAIALAIGHGLLVGLLWDDLSQPGELQMGIKLS